MTDRTYSDLFDLVEGLAGVDSFTDGEATQVLGFINRRLYQAYMASPLWPRYVVGAEERAATDSVIPYSEGVLSDIEHFHRIWDANPLDKLSAREYEFYVDSSGAHVINNTKGVESFWVHYKKAWGGPYTSSATNIPQEFFWYAAHAAYADFLRMDGQTDKAMQEEANAQQYLVVELDRAAHQKNVNNLYSRFQTHLSNQSR